MLWHLIIFSSYSRHIFDTGCWLDFYGRYRYNIFFAFENHCLTLAVHVNNLSLICHWYRMVLEPLQRLRKCLLVASAQTQLKSTWRSISPDMAELRVSRWLRIKKLANHVVLDLLHTSIMTLLTKFVVGFAAFAFVILELRMFIIGTLWAAARCCLSIENEIL